MSTKKAGVEAGNTLLNDRHSTSRARAKAFIVGKGCWGVIPISVADWLIRRLNLEARR